MIVDRAANELYVADGYVNHRLIVFDATTGAYKRHWGAYGKPPDDGYFTQAGERLPGPFSGAVQNENQPEPTTILTARRRRSSGSSTPCASLATGWCMSATAPTIASRSFARMAPSCERDSSRSRRSGADQSGTSRFQPIRRRRS